MPIDFPSSPTTGQVYTYLGKSWVYNGTGWDAPRALSEIGAVRTFANAAARNAAIPSPTNGIVTYLEDTKLFQTWNSSAWIIIANGGSPSFGFTGTIIWTASTTFTKATYPWLRAMRIRVQGAGGGGGGCQATGSNQTSLGGSGSGGSYSEFVTSDIAGLPSSVSVTVGAGGAGGVSGGGAGSNGGSSSFGSLVSADGGLGGNGGSVGPAGIFYNTGKPGASAGVGTLIIPGGSSRPSFGFSASEAVNSEGGDSYLSATQETQYGSVNGKTGTGFGSGGSGGQNAQSQATGRTGGSGANGLVIVELYA
jgi:hypothetical protein